MGGDIYKPIDEDELCDVVSNALAHEIPLEVVGTGSKRGLGRPVYAERTITTKALSGITLYEPEELVLRARAGTPLSIIQAALDEEGQCLAFEPPDWGPLFGAIPDGATIGGVIGSNISGSRRFSAGAARDHLLGVRAVTGRGEVIKTGGRVVKNVTGYDLCKLFTGSYGTLGVMTEVTLKVVPTPEKTRTILVFGLDATNAQTVMADILKGPHYVSAAAYLPQAIAQRSNVQYVVQPELSVAAFRLEGPGPSVIARCETVRTMMETYGRVEELHFHNSQLLWSEIGRVAYFAEKSQVPVWRVSIPPVNMTRVNGILESHGISEVYFDWGGGLLWVKIDDRFEDAGAAIIRGAIANCGGHATLIRATGALRSHVPVFQPATVAISALSARLKHGFDPHHILNRGRMVAGA